MSDESIQTQRGHSSRRIGIPRALVFALVGSLLMLTALLIADLTAPSIFDSLRNIVATPNSKQTHHFAPAPSAQHAPKTHAPKPSAHAPVLTGLSPESATPGSTIELSGTGFFSANNEITARVAGTPAPTRCPTRQSCLVVLPAASKGATETSIQIVTEAGSSNSLPIRYG